ncbi:MAG TPA: hypothetical protein VM915_03340 [Verrucomicrobiae bacterium]|jgi:hypothetical protein|nr:hypothetical protein [Verrucomicrobiae bacterium]
MSGWRDADGRTAADRQKQENQASQARFAERVRNRPLSLVKPLLSAAFIGVLIIALLLAFT